MGSLRGRSSRFWDGIRGKEKSEYLCIFYGSMHR
jgi:hypothetical protein